MAPLLLLFSSLAGPVPPASQSRPALVAMAPRVQQELTDLPERLAWTALFAVLVAAVYLAMWRAWRRRSAAQAGQFSLPVLPAEGSHERARVPAEYVATTVAGDWLARVSAHGLGVRSPAEVVVRDDGLVVHRPGVPPLFLPRPSLTGVRRADGMAGKFVEAGGLVVVRWRAAQGLEQGLEQDLELETGLRCRHASDSGRLVDELRSLLAPAVGAPPAADFPSAAEPDGGAGSAMQGR